MAGCCPAEFFGRQHCSVHLYGELKMKKRFTLLLLSLFFSFSAITVTAHHEPATNKDGSIVTGVLTASFDPFGSPGGERYLHFLPIWVFRN